MKAVIKKTELARLLSLAKQAVPSKSAESQFLNFLIESDGERLSITTSDGSLSCKVTTGKTDEQGKEVITNLEEGACQVDANTLLGLINNTDADSVTIEEVDSTFILSEDDKEGVTKLNTRAAEEYPDIDFSLPSDVVGLKISIKDIKKLFECSAYAAATKGPKELYQGVNIKAADDKVTFTATDSYRVAILSLKEVTNGLSFNFTCPVKPLEMITKNASGECEIYLDEKRAIFVLKDMIITTKIIHGDFPNIDRLIPTSLPYSLTVNSSEFINTANYIKILLASDSRTPTAIVTMTNTGASMSTNNPNKGSTDKYFKSAKVVLPEGQDVFKIAFNIDFALDTVRALNSDEITFKFCSPTRLFLIDCGDQDCIQIITPIRMAN